VAFRSGVGRGCTRQPPGAGATAQPAIVLVACPQCAGNGIIPCPAHRKNGKLRCPGNCLKMDDPRWQVKAVPGHDPTEKWMVFPYHDANGSGYGSWSQMHCGQVIVDQNGRPVNIGACPICHGTCQVDCKACKGLGHLTCPLCAGKKTISQEQADAYQEHQRREHEQLAIHLLDGRTIYGRVIGSAGDSVMISTEEKKLVTEKIANLPPGLRTTPAAHSDDGGAPGAGTPEAGSAPSRIGWFIEADACSRTHREHLRLPALSHHPHATPAWVILRPLQHHVLGHLGHPRYPCWVVLTLSTPFPSRSSQRWAFLTAASVRMSLKRAQRMAAPVSAQRRFQATRKPKVNRLGGICRRS
jgi:hypothetical protein